ncbi:MAG: rRNA maturation RNase YbeY [Phycisphaerales bacterium]|nr:rRNA maturation RNase YbeY [Phycisphaerales bacterium]
MSRGIPDAGRSGAGHLAPAHAAAGEPPVEVDLIDATGELSSADQRWIVEQTHATLRQLPALGYPIASGSVVAVRVIGDAEMSQVHERYSGIAGTTDVLTFDHGPGFSSDRPTLLETDLLICLDEARRQARPRGLAVRHELLLYIVHGILHCLGHDDHDDAAFTRMHQLEDQLMLALGLPMAFAAPLADAPSARNAQGNAEVRSS